MQNGRTSKSALGVIFLTIFIDLLGFTIVFPLFPAILDHYLKVDGTGGFLGWIVYQIGSDRLMETPRVKVMNIDLTLASIGKKIDTLVLKYQL